MNDLYFLRYLVNIREFDKKKMILIHASPNIIPDTNTCSSTSTHICAKALSGARVCPCTKYSSAFPCALGALRQPDSTHQHTDINDIHTSHRGNSSLFRLVHQPSAVPSARPFGWIGGGCRAGAADPVKVAGGVATCGYLFILYSPQRLLVRCG